MKKKTDKKKIMAWFIIIVMVASVLGYVGGSFFSEKEITKEEYNGFTFNKAQSGWMLITNQQNYGFQYLPRELENLSLPVQVKDWHGEDKIYFAYEPENELNVQSYLDYLSSVFYIEGIRPQRACTEEKSCGDYPILNCQNKGIILTSGKTTQFRSKDNCLIAIAPDLEELKKLTERIIYNFLGVMI